MPTVRSATHLQVCLTHAARAADWRLSPQGDDYWQDCFTRLDIYSKPTADRTPWETEFLDHNPNFQADSNLSDIRSYTPITLEFHQSLNQGNLSVAHQYLLESLSYHLTQEKAFIPGPSVPSSAGLFWQRRAALFTQYYQDTGTVKKYYRNYLIPRFPDSIF